VADSDSLYGGTVAKLPISSLRLEATVSPLRWITRTTKPVAALFERVKAEHGRLDILVKQRAKLVPLLRRRFWEKPLEAVDLITVGLRSHFVAAYYAAPLLKQTVAV